MVPTEHSGFRLPGYVPGLLAERPQQVQVLGVEGGQARVQDQGLYVVLVDGRLGPGNLRHSNLEHKWYKNNSDGKKQSKANASTQLRLRTDHTMNKQRVSEAEDSLGPVRHAAHLPADGSGRLKQTANAEMIQSTNIKCHQVRNVKPEEKRQ